MSAEIAKEKPKKQYGRKPKTGDKKKEKFVKKPKRTQKFSRTDQINEILNDSILNQLDSEKKLKCEKLSKQLQELAALKLPQKAFIKFLIEQRKVAGQEKITSKEIKEKWGQTSVAERDRLIKQSKAEFAEFNKKMKDFNLKKKELRKLVEVKPEKPEKPKEVLAKAKRLSPFELFFKEYSETQKKGLELKEAKAEAYAEWKKLDSKKKKLFVCQSMFEKEKIIHEKTLEELSKQIAALKAK